MKLMIASDLHGSAYYTGRLLDAYRAEAPQKLLLLGDLLYHGPRNALPRDYNCMAAAGMLNGIKDHIIAVRGNCDCEVDQMVLEFPMMADYAMLEWEGTALYATHGHLWNEQQTPPMSSGTVLLNGHFHVPTAHRHDGWHYINPGSTSIPKDGSVGSYLLLEDRVFTWKDMDGNPYQTYALD
ncbi:MAG: phosphodiesterase [Oscillospiraceae bacterium]|nr:phosphodiesterase [Oscillospiraceae bacterium]